MDMKKLHEDLAKKYTWYAAWHEHARHAGMHWVLFALFALSVTTSLVIQFQSGFAKIETITKNSVALTRAPHSQGRAIDAGAAHILVAFNPRVNSKAKAAVLERHNLKEAFKIEELGVTLLDIPRGQDLQDVIDRLLKEEGDAIEFAEPDALVEPSFIPNDPNYPDQWYHTRIHSPAAWDATTGNTITIAIVDTGVDLAHPDLAAHLVPGWNFFENNSNAYDVFGHGTVVAGAAAAIGENSAQVAGVAYNALIMPLRVSDTNGNASYSTIAQAIIYAADHGAKVANVSYQVGGSSAVERAARYMLRKGGLTVVAEGNGGSLTKYKNSSAMIGVSATDNYDLATAWSNFGNAVDLAAPGQAIFTTTRGGGTDYYSGTSLSAPITSGIIALVWSLHPTFAPDQIQNIVFKSAIDLGPAGWDQKYGWGRIDAGNAVGAALAQ
jgi:thermitase